MQLCNLVERKLKQFGLLAHFFCALASALDHVLLVERHHHLGMGADEEAEHERGRDGEGRKSDVHQVDGESDWVRQPKECLPRMPTPDLPKSKAAATPRGHP